MAQPRAEQHHLGLMTEHRIEILPLQRLEPGHSPGLHRSGHHDQVSSVARAVDLDIAGP